MSSHWQVLLQVCDKLADFITEEHDRHNTCKMRNRGLLALIELNCSHSYTRLLAGRVIRVHQIANSKGGSHITSLRAFEAIFGGFSPFFS